MKGKHWSNIKPKAAQIIGGRRVLFGQRLTPAYSRNLLPAEEYPGADSTAPAGVPADGNVNRWVNSSHNRRVEEVRTTVQFPVPPSRPTHLNKPYPDFVQTLRAKKGPTDVTHQHQTQKEEAQTTRHNQNKIGIVLHP